LNILINDLVQSDLLILKFDLIVLNEQNADKCKAKINVTKEDNLDMLKRHSLEIDTTTFNSDLLLNSDELDVNCMLDIHYTNKSGSDENLCYKLKFKIIIKFVQIVHISLINIEDIE